MHTNGTGARTAEDSISAGLISCRTLVIGLGCVLAAAMSACAVPAIHSLPASTRVSLDALTGTWAIESNPERRECTVALEGASGLDGYRVTMHDDGGADTTGWPADIIEKYNAAVGSRDEVLFVTFHEVDGSYIAAVTIHEEAALGRMGWYDTLVVPAHQFALVEIVERDRVRVTGLESKWLEPILRDGGLEMVVVEQREGARGAAAITSGPETLRKLLQRALRERTRAFQESKVYVRMPLNGDRPAD